MRHLVEIISLVAGVCGWLVAYAAAAASLQQNPEVERFIDEVVADHRFDRNRLKSWFSQARLQNSVLKAMSSPGTARPWYEYRARQVTEARLRTGLDYWQRHSDTLARARTEYGVPEEIIVATIGIETFYGRIMGNHPVFDALATLAFSYPPRAELFRSELVEFLLLSRESGENPLRFKGSYAGALGIAQFLPSSYRRYAVDFNGDGKRDLWDHGDAIGSVANYYKAYGWKPEEKVIVALEQPAEPASDEFKALLGRGLSPHTPVAAIRRTGVSPAEMVADDELASVITAEVASGMRYWMGFNNFYVITRYNRSVNYALAVFELSQELRRARQSEATR